MPHIEGVATESEEYSLSIAIPAEYFFVEDLFIDLCRLSTTALRRNPAYFKYVVLILNFVVMGKPLSYLFNNCQFTTIP